MWKHDNKEQYIVKAKIERTFKNDKISISYLNKTINVTFPQPSNEQEIQQEIQQDIQDIDFIKFLNSELGECKEYFCIIHETDADREHSLGWLYLDLEEKIKSLTIKELS